VKYSKTQLLV